MGKNNMEWNNAANKLAKEFWPGPLTMVLPLSEKISALSMLVSQIGLGLRLPNHKIAQDLAHQLKRPITATSANRSRQPDCYSAPEIIKHFQSQRNKPDIIIDAGTLAKQRPSTVIAIVGNKPVLLRSGPVSFNKIKSILRT